MRAVTIGESNLPFKHLSEFLIEKEFSVEHLDHRSSRETMRGLFKSHTPWLVFIDQAHRSRHLFSILEESKKWGCKNIFINSDDDNASVWNEIGYSVIGTLNMPLDPKQLEHLYKMIQGKERNLKIDWPQIKAGLN